MGATASGKVLQIAVSEGSRVVQGQVVLRLDPANAQIALRNAELALQQAQVNLERAQRSTAGSLAPCRPAWNRPRPTSRWPSGATGKASSSSRLGPLPRWSLLASGCLQPGQGRLRQRP